MSLGGPGPPAPASEPVGRHGPFLPDQDLPRLDARGHELLSTQLHAGEQRASWLPHREKYLLLAIGFLRRLFEIHLVEPVDKVERELAVPRAPVP